MTELTHNGHPYYRRGEFAVYFRDGLWRLATSCELGQGTATAEEQLALADNAIANESEKDNDPYYPGQCGRRHHGD